MTVPSTAPPPLGGSPRPKLLDLYCCQGGAGMGYHLAGWDVVGVDIAPQPRYPFPFVQADAIAYAAAHWREYDAIHASPPCQALTTMSNRHRGKGTKADDHVNLIPQTRAALPDAPRAGFMAWAEAYEVQEVLRAGFGWQPGDPVPVLTPFAGVGSEVYGAVQLGRRGVGIELKPSYYRQALKNLAAVDTDHVDDQPLFDLEDA